MLGEKTFLVSRAFRAVALAESVAVIVLNHQKTFPLDTTMSILSIGLFCLALSSLMEPYTAESRRRR